MEENKEELISEEMISASLEEVQNKSLEQIQHETGLKWGSRAIAAYVLALQAKDLSDKLVWLMLGEEFATESIEHLSQCSDVNNLVKLKEQLSKYSNAVLNSIVN